MKALRSEQSSLAASVWLDTVEDLIEEQPLAGTRRAEVCVIGAGFTGLSAALHLAESGREVVVLDAQHAGWGASGRNGGQVIPGIKIAPGTLEKAFGEARAWDILQATLGSADFTYDLVDRLKISCNLRRKGWIQGAVNERILGSLSDRVQSQEGRILGYELLTPQSVAELTGSPIYIGGMLVRQAAVVHPLKLALGLARAVRAAGGQIHGCSPVLSVTGTQGNFTVKAADGEIRCDSVVVAANGYLDNVFPQLKRSVVPVVSLQVASGPLPDRVREAVLPGQVAVSDIRGLTYYFHVDADGRLLFGGRGAFRDRDNARLAAGLKAFAEQVFPQISGHVRWRYQWGGRVAMTPSHVPQLVQAQPGMAAAFGYSGRGVAMAVLMGSFLARLTQGAPVESIPFPVTPPTPIPFHAFNCIGVAATVSYLRLRDHLARM